uniref:CSON002936 protein n=1 Tax=Culicoides sonorensis TaxID=179676 RepID=A0A336LM45_CULSO
MLQTFRLQSDTFKTKNIDEDEHLAGAIFRTKFFHRLGIGLCIVAIFQWSLVLFIPGIFGSFYCAVIFWSMDTIMTGILYHTTAQIKRLGSDLSNLGYDRKFNIKTNYVLSVDSKKFEKPIIIQVGISVFAICFTMFILMSSLNGNLLGSLDVLPYFFGVSFQIFQVCYAGNELFYALTFNIYSSNFMVLDLKSKKLLVTFMERNLDSIELLFDNQVSNSSPKLLLAFYYFPMQALYLLHIQHETEDQFLSV